MNKLDASRYKRTKIIATIGPASELHLESLLRSGVNGMRLNFSHNRHSWHANVITQIRQYAEKLNRSVAIIQDLQGPKIRVGVLPSTIEVKAGDELKFRFDADYAKTGIIPIQFDFSPMVKKGDRVYIRDGAIISEVMKVREGVVTVIVRSGGKFGGSMALIYRTQS